MTESNDYVYAAMNETFLQHGMTKREYFAAMALQGLLCDVRSSGSFENYASDAEAYADALIKALNENPCTPNQ